MAAPTGHPRARPARPDRARPAHTTARPSGLRVSARHLRRTVAPAPFDLARRKLAAGRALVGTGAALFAAAALSFGAALLFSRVFG